MELHELVAQIDDAIVAELEAQKTAIGATKVILGEEADVSELARKAVWVIPEDAFIDSVGGAGSEEWIYPINVVGVVGAERPQKGRKDAAAMAAKASTVLVRRGRESASTLGGLVRDVLRSAYMPGGSPELQQEGLQEAGYRLEIRFRYREETS